MRISQKYSLLRRTLQSIGGCKLNMAVNIFLCNVIAFILEIFFFVVWIWYSLFLHLRSTQKDIILKPKFVKLPLLDRDISFFLQFLCRWPCYTVPRNLPWAAAPKKYKIPRSKGRLWAIFNFLCTLKTEEILNYVLFYKNNKYCFDWV